MCYTDENKTIKWSFFNVIENLQKVIDKAGDSEEAASEEKQEMEELRDLLPELKEKVEDAQEGLRATTAAVVDMKEMLVSRWDADVGFSAVDGRMTKWSSLRFDTNCFFKIYFKLVSNFSRMVDRLPRPSLPQVYKTVKPLQALR